MVWAGAEIWVLVDPFSISGSTISWTPLSTRKSPLSPPKVHQSPQHDVRQRRTTDHGDCDSNADVDWHRESLFGRLISSLSGKQATSGQQSCGQAAALRLFSTHAATPHHYMSNTTRPVTPVNQPPESALFSLQPVAITKINDRASVFVGRVVMHYCHVGVISQQSARTHVV